MDYEKLNRLYVYNNSNNNLLPIKKSLNNVSLTNIQNKKIENELNNLPNNIDKREYIYLKNDNTKNLKLINNENYIIHMEHLYNKKMNNTVKNMNVNTNINNVNNDKNNVNRNFITNFAESKKNNEYVLKIHNFINQHNINTYKMMCSQFNNELNMNNLNKKIILMNNQNNNNLNFKNNLYIMNNKNYKVNDYTQNVPINRDNIKLNETPYEENKNYKFMSGNIYEHDNVNNFTKNNKQVLQNNCNSSDIRKLIQSYKQYKEQEEKKIEEEKKKLFDGKNKDTKKNSNKENNYINNIIKSNKSISSEKKMKENTYEKKKKILKEKKNKKIEEMEYVDKNIYNNQINNNDNLINNKINVMNENMPLDKLKSLNVNNFKINMSKNDISNNEIKHSIYENKNYEDLLKLEKVKKTYENIRTDDEISNNSMKCESNEKTNLSKNYYMKKYIKKEKEQICYENVNTNYLKKNFHDNMNNSNVYQKNNINKKYSDTNIKNDNKKINNRKDTFINSSTFEDETEELKLIKNNYELCKNINYDKENYKQKNYRNLSDLKYSEFKNEIDIYYEKRKKQVNEFKDELPSGIENISIDDNSSLETPIDFNDIKKKESLKKEINIKNEIIKTNSKTEKNNYNIKINNDKGENNKSIENDKKHSYEKNENKMILNNYSECETYDTSERNKSIFNEEVNFLNKDNINNVNILNKKIISNNNTIIPYNIMKDVEQEKTKKLFFEDICVFRLIETNDNRRNQIPINLFCDKSLNDIILKKIEINKQHYKDINEEINNLIKKEDIYELEMNIGLVFRKFIPVTMNLSSEYLLIKKKENSLIICISFTNIIEINIVKKNEKKKIYLFKIAYIFKKKKQKEKKITLLFKTNNFDIYEKIKEKVEPIINNEYKKKEYLDIETIYDYVIQKYKRIHVLYLKILLRNVEKIFRKFYFKIFFKHLKLKYFFLKEKKHMEIEKKKIFIEGINMLKNCFIKKMKKYFNLLLIKSYENSLITYQIKTNDLMFNMILNEKITNKKNIEKHSAFLLYNILSNVYKRRMYIYFKSFNKKAVHDIDKKMNAFIYTITHLNSILVKYERRIKLYVLAILKFQYAKILHFSFILYRIYLRRIFIGYLVIRDNRLKRKLLIEKFVWKFIKIMYRLIENEKYFALLKIQKNVYEENEKKNKIILDNLVYANNELCNNMDKIAIEKGFNKLEHIYKFKLKENLVKCFYKLKGSNINSESFNNTLKYCSIFVFVLKKFLYRKVQNFLYFFILKCYQNNNANKLIYSIRKLEILLIKKEKTQFMDLLKLFSEFPYLFKYRHLTNIEIFVKAIQNFINFCNRKMILNFFLKLHYLKYQGNVIKAYLCINNLYKFLNALNYIFRSNLNESFRLLIKNAKEKKIKMLEEKFDLKKSQLLKKTKINCKNLEKYSSLKLGYISDEMSSNRLTFMKKYPLLFYNSDISPDYATTMTDDKLSLKSNDSVICNLTNTYDDVDKIKRKIYNSYNTTISKIN